MNMTNMEETACLKVCTNKVCTKQRDGKKNKYVTLMSQSV